MKLIFEGENFETVKDQIVQFLQDTGAATVDEDGPTEAPARIPAPAPLPQKRKRRTKAEMAAAAAGTADDDQDPPSRPATPPPAPAPVGPTMEDVEAAAKELRSDYGRVALRSVLTRCGVESLDDLDANDFQKFLEECKAMAD